MRMVVVALLTASLGLPAGQVSAQVLEKAAPDEVHLSLTQAHRMGMTHARRIENAEPADAEATVREIDALAAALADAAAELDDVAKAIGPGHEAEIEAIRKCQQAAQPHVQALSGLKDKPVSAAARAHAAAVREQLDLAEDAHQKLMKALSAAKAAAPSPATPAPVTPGRVTPSPTVPKPDTTKPAGR